MCILQMIYKINIIDQKLDLIYQIHLLREKALQKPKTLRYIIFLQIVNLEKELNRLNLLSEIRRWFRI